MMRTMTFRLSIVWPLTAAAVLSAGLAATAQKTQNEPATDSAAQSSPIQPTPPAPVTDSAAQASPDPSRNGRGVSIAPHTVIDVKLGRSIDSGRLKNGDMVAATLAKPVALVPKGMLDAGTAAELTVVETLAAGRIYAAGEFSLQVERVGSIPVYTNTLTYRGQPGHKDLPDSAPTVGTDAELAAGAELIFHVLPPPEPAKGPPKGSSRGDRGRWMVLRSAARLRRNHRRSRVRMAREKLAQVRRTAPRPSRLRRPPIRRRRNAGKSSPAPNQPAPPSGTSSTPTTKPHP